MAFGATVPKGGIPLRVFKDCISASLPFAFEMFGYFPLLVLTGIHHFWKHVYSSQGLHPQMEESTLRQSVQIKPTVATTAKIGKQELLAGDDVDTVHHSRTPTARARTRTRTHAQVSKGQSQPELGAAAFLVLYMVPGIPFEYQVLIVTHFVLGSCFFAGTLAGWIRNVHFLLDTNSGMCFVGICQQTNHLIWEIWRHQNVPKIEGP